MPYIRQVDRAKFDEHVNKLIPNITCAGDLNYIISSMCSKLMEPPNVKNYTRINELIGALECVKLELYRRVAASYENQKTVENGEVFYC